MQSYDLTEKERLYSLKAFALNFPKFDCRENGNEIFEMIKFSYHMLSMNTASNFYR